MAIVDEEDKPKRGGDDEVPERREREQIKANKLGKSLATIMIIAIAVMILLYFWPIIRLW